MPNVCASKSLTKKKYVTLTMTSKKEFVNRSVCYLNKIFYAGALNTERPRFLSDPPAPRMHLPESRILDSCLSDDMPSICKAG